MNIFRRMVRRMSTTMEAEIRRAMDAGVSCSSRYSVDDYPFRWAENHESAEVRLNNLTTLAVNLRKNSRKYSILYPGGPVVAFSERLDAFLSDEKFKKNLLQETEAREVEVQKSRAMVEAVRAGKDRHPAFLELVEAETLSDITKAQRQMNTMLIGREVGYLPADLPSWIAIDWEETADNVREDYTEVEFRGETYLAR